MDEYERKEYEAFLEMERESDKLQGDKFSLSKLLTILTVLEIPNTLYSKLTLSQIFDLIDEVSDVRFKKRA